MNRGSRQNLVTSAAQRLQAGYARRRAAARGAYEQLHAAGAFTSTTGGPQAELDLILPAPLRADDSQAEAA